MNVMSGLRASITTTVLLASCGFPACATEQLARPVLQGKSIALHSSEAHEVIHSEEAYLAAVIAAQTDAAGNHPLIPPNPSKVDFAKQMILGLSMPSQPSSCTAVSIRSIQKRADVIEVLYRLEGPAEGSVCLTSLFSPFVFVATDNSMLPIVWQQDGSPP